ncbi:hypothetical protein COU58_03075 [Candidatus Pacearchaeota archaeon CG10_big_fil_rev_8_21_14_0_10_32_42]|nr:MAG: hypothetical protein COU58_03075 [Candidatus Pacearchaeota archaeon CG10_big_fil_rev_8_21_14_0_10_32_42]
MVKVDFVWSFIYEQVVHNQTVDEEFDYGRYEEFVNLFIKKVEPTWKKIEQEIFAYCEKITDLKFKKQTIPVYVIKISSIMPISDPLTIPIQFQSGEEIFSLTPNRFIDMMIHELIHNLFIQNDKEMGDYFGFILEKYKKEDFDTAIHLLVHAIHKKIILKYFDKERLKEEIKMSSFYPAYKRSWEIVSEKDEDFIIKEFKNYLAGLPKEKA